MIRRPLTEIKLRLEDLQEYENSRREQNHLSIVQELRDESSTIITPTNGGPKTTEEIHNRIGFAPKKKSSESRL
ncbi:unnamed protein product [Pieris macdunnoughi]|uniref:Cell division cycle protein 26 homolog n=2 Tax=Pieris TaxID=7115 RepID=A0A9P0TEL9_PIEBR|nr:unnamed protein product [Pieris macdunnoughi]CAH4030050.1 unnamed protein product [Pieris brassicae]